MKCGSRATEHGISEKKRVFSERKSKNRSRQALSPREEGRDVRGEARTVRYEEKAANKMRLGSVGGAATKMTQNGVEQEMEEGEGLVGEEEEEEEVE